MICRSRIPGLAGALFSCILMILPFAGPASIAVASTGMYLDAQTPGGDDDDPDLPGNLGKGIDKTEYLLMRESHIGLLRGLPNVLPYNPRVQAIGVMEAQHHLMKTSATATTSWTELGPSPIPNGQTSPANPVSGRVTAIAVHPTDPNIVYVGTAQGGLYRTLDGGATWTQLFDNALSLAIGAVAVDPINPTNVFVGTGEGNLSIDSYAGVGLYVIKNADTSPIISGPFETQTNGTTTHAFLNTSITSIQVDPKNDSVIFVGNTLGFGGVSSSYTLVAALGLHYCSNALSTTPTFAFVTGLPGAGLAGVTDVAMKPGAPDTLVVGIEDFTGAATDGIYRSVNATAGTSSTWTRVLSFGSSETNVRFAANKVGSAVTMIAGIQSGNGTMQKSTDAGATWSAVSGLSNYCGGQCWYDIAPAIDPTNASIIYIGGSADASTSAILEKSTNGGSSFSVSDAGLHADVHAVTVSPSNGSIIYTGNDGGIFKSTNAGTSWISLNNAGFNAIQFESIALHPIDGNFSIGGTQDNGTNFRHPTTVWSRADFGDGGFALIDQNATDTLNVTMYHTYYNATGSLIGLARVTSTTNAVDAGWAFLGYGGTANGISGSDAVLFYAPMTLGPGNPNTVYFGTDRLYRSTNKGTTMTVVSQAPLATSVPISAIGISKLSDNVRIVGLRNGKVYATSTGSSTLTDVTGSIPAYYIARAVIDPNSSTTAYVTLSGFGLAAGQHIWKTINLNVATPTWTAAGTGIPDVPVNGFVIDPANSSHLFAGTDIGVYASTDGGTSWNPLGTGLPRVAVFDMAIQNVSRTLRIATHGRGMWEIPIDVALPIQLAQFQGAATGKNVVRLEWTTVSEIDNYGFEVQRHPDSASIFQSVPGSFLAGHGTSTDPHSYVYTDETPAAGIYLYRLKQSDLDGSMSFSEALKINTNDAAIVQAIPDEYRLDQNFPNPFNPSTLIRYGIPSAGWVTVEVFDLLGQRVAVLVNGVQEEGFHQVVFDGRGLASGVYVYRIQAGPYLASRKLMLLR